MNDTTPTPRGRPRNPDIDAIVLETTRELLSQVGFTATTVQEISRRSGVHPPAIYRRWPSRLALIEDAAFSGLREINVEPTGDLRGDLRRFLRAYERSLGAPAARAAMPGLMANYLHDGPPPATQWLALSVRPQFYEILRAAPDEVDADLDPDEVFDLVQGAVLARITVPLIAARRTRIDTLVEMVVRILAGPVGGVSPARPGAPRSARRP
jgi:AcrR family transcriptional regulator